MTRKVSKIKSIIQENIRMSLFFKNLNLKLFSPIKMFKIRRLNKKEFSVKIAPGNIEI